MPAMTDATSEIAAAPADPLQAGRDALARRAWPEAFDLLSQADADGALSGSDLEAFALAAFFAARADVEIGVKERAFAAYVTEDNGLRAAYMALDVARESDSPASSRSPPPGHVGPRRSSGRMATRTRTATSR